MSATSLARWVHRAFSFDFRPAPRSQRVRARPSVESLEERRLLAVTILDLGAFGSGYFSAANGINDAGQVTGYAYTSGNAAYHAFLYSDGVMTDLGTVSGGPYSSGNAINASGQVAGDGYTPMLDDHAFLSSPQGGLIDLGTFGGFHSAAWGINSAGWVVGGADLPGDTVTHAFLYTGGPLTDLGTLGGANSYARGINDTGSVVGYSGTATGVDHAFEYTNGVMTDLGSLGGGFSRAFAINAAGQVVGATEIGSDHTYHAFLYSNGVMSDLGTLGGDFSSARAINAAGQVVGDSGVSPHNHYPDAFLYSNGVMTDLNSLLPEGSGWWLVSAWGINNHNQIVGFGSHNGLQRAFLLDLGSPDTTASLGTAPLPQSARLWVAQMPGNPVTGTASSAAPVAPLPAPETPPRVAVGQTTFGVEAVDHYFSTIHGEAQALAPVMLPDLLIGGI